MASTPLKDLKDQLNCTICFEQYKDPKILPCHHSFCKECLEKTLQKTGRRRTTILNCPICRKSVQLTDRGVQALPSSFFIDYLLELHQKMENFSINPVNSDNAWPCPEHNKPLELYCNNCDTVICQHCVTREHRGHVCDLAIEAFDKCMSPVHELLATLHSKIERVGLVSQALDKVESDVTAQYKTVKQQVNEVADELIMKIHMSRRNILSEVEACEQEKYTAINVEREKAREMRRKLKASEQSVKKVLNEGSKQKIMVSKNDMVRELELANDTAELAKPKTEEGIDESLRVKGKFLEELQRELGASNHSHRRPVSKPPSKPPQTQNSTRFQNPGAVGVGHPSQSKDCPMCGKQFPGTMAQTDFEEHVNSHFPVDNLLF